MEWHNVSVFVCVYYSPHEDTTLNVTFPSLLRRSKSVVRRSALPGVRTPLLILDLSARNVRATFMKRIGVDT